jgi:hypothetical protein
MKREIERGRRERCVGRGIIMGERESDGIFCDREFYSYWCGKSVSSSYLSIQFRKFQHVVTEIIIIHLLNPNRVKEEFIFNVPIIFI